MLGPVKAVTKSDQVPALPGSQSRGKDSLQLHNRMNKCEITVVTHVKRDWRCYLEGGRVEDTG